MTSNDPYDTRYADVLLLVDRHLTELRRAGLALPRSSVQDGSAQSHAGASEERQVLWAAVDSIAGQNKDLQAMLPAVKDFKALNTLGSGRFGTVEVVRSSFDTQLYAMKTISKLAIKRSGTSSCLGIERHIHLLATPPSTSHSKSPIWTPAPSLHAAFQSDDSLHLVLELAHCGPLWDRMGLEMEESFPSASPLQTADEMSRRDNRFEPRRMQEKEVTWWAAQMVLAIRWLHGKGYAHRDIKPQNFLIDSSARILLTDFGVAAPLDPQSDIHGVPCVLQRYCSVPTGTPDYIAPEVLEAGEVALARIWSDEADDGEEEDGGPVYTASIDLWSLGATIHEMATGQAPFIARSISDTYARIMACDLQIQVLDQAGLSVTLKDLICRLLCPAPDRIDFAGLLKHPFFASVNWSLIQHGTARPPDCMSPVTPRGLADESDRSASFAQGLNAFSFTLQPAYDMTSPASNYIANFTQHTQQLDDPHEWDGWTWMPDPSTLQIPSYPALASEGRQTATRSSAWDMTSPERREPSHGDAEDMADRYRTPMRQVLHSNSHLKPPPSTAKRLTRQNTPAGTGNAYFDLLKCVHESARKRAHAKERKGSSSPRPPVAKTSKEATNETAHRMIASAPKERPTTVEEVEIGVDRLIDELGHLRARLAEIRLNTV